MDKDNFDRKCQWCGEESMERNKDGLVECSNGCGFTNYFASHTFDNIERVKVYSQKRLNYSSAKLEAK